MRVGPNYMLISPPGWVPFARPLPFEFALHERTVQATLCGDPACVGVAPMVPAAAQPLQCQDPALVETGRPACREKDASVRLQPPCHLLQQPAAMVPIRPPSASGTGLGRR